MIRPFELEELALATRGHLAGSNLLVSSVSTDSRKLAEGALFVALQGENFDGHDFIEQALSQGAEAVMINRSMDFDIPQLVVEDTQLGLGQIAQFNRELFRGPIVGLTGSTGKTGTKEMLASILRCKHEVLATEGNFNNEIGVPLTLLGLQAEHRFAVVEMGASKSGDIAYLAAMVKPDVALVTNVMPAHVAGFGSLEKLAATKKSIYSALPEGGTAVVNLDDQTTASWLSEVGKNRSLCFSTSNAEADVYAVDVAVQACEGSRFTLVTPAYSVDVTLKLLGRHQISNALAAAACAYALDLDAEDIANGLAQVSAVAGRMCPLPGKNETLLIDDSYNASPGAMKAAIEELASRDSTRILVIGQMAELGADEERYHRDVGTQAKQAGIEHLLALGPLAGVAADAFGPNGKQFDSVTDLAGACLALMNSGTAVLVKGSRSARMERVVAELVDSQIGEVH